MARHFSQQRTAAAGFTLVELMVSMTGGLFLTITLFALAKNASALYQQETRVANATISSVTGFERLWNDVARAGHMSTANIATDPRVCNRPNPTWPDGIERLRAAAIDTSGAANAESGIAPHAITISGALDATEELYTNTIQPAANGYSISLNLQTPSALRLGLNPALGAANQAALDAVFMTNNGTAGRIVRLRKDGSEQYGVVSSVVASASTAVINLAANPGLVFRAVGSVHCGIDGLGSGFSLSVINIVRYKIASMKTATAYASLFAASDSPYDAARTELQRVEIDANGNEIDSTRELISEYAVNLRFTPWAIVGGTDPTLDPNATAASFSENAGFPERLRGMRVRLSLRSRAPDLLGAIDGNDCADAVYCLKSGSDFYRVRTSEADVALRNLEGSNW
jgi:type II secretory pathway pseudopilin PulG